MSSVRETVLPFLAAWGYGPESVGAVEPVLDVYRIETRDGAKNLKRTRLSPDKLRFVLSGLQHLHRNRFRALCLPLPTKDGTPFLDRGGWRYLLSDWIEGRQADLGRPAELSAAVRTLAAFHQASRGYRPPMESNSRFHWGNLLVSFFKRCEEMRRLALETRRRMAATGFDREIRAEIDYYLALADFARDLLSASSYKALAAEAAEEGGLCHGDVAARNFIQTPRGDVFLIDFDGLRQDLPLMDLWKLFRRLMKTHGWDSGLGRSILRTYEDVKPLSPAELEVLLALTAFPQKYWRLASRYYGGRYAVQEESYQRKLRKYTRHREAHAAFVSDLAALCRERGVRRVWPAGPLSLPGGVTAAAE